MASITRPQGQERGFHLNLQPPSVANENGGTFAQGGDHGCHPQSRAPTSLWETICTNVLSLSTSRRDGRMGSAQSQSSRKSHGSIPHPAVSPNAKISAVGVANFMTGLLRYLHRPHPRIGLPNCQIGFGLMATMSDQGPNRKTDCGSYRTPESDASTKPGERRGDEHAHHGVLPVRWSSIRAFRAFTA